MTASEFLNGKKGFIVVLSGLEESGIKDLIGKLFENNKITQHVNEPPYDTKQENTQMPIATVIPPPEKKNKSPIFTLRFPAKENSQQHVIHSSFSGQKAELPDNQEKNVIESVKGTKATKTDLSDKIGEIKVFSIRFPNKNRNISKIEKVVISNESDEDSLNGDELKQVLNAVFDSLEVATKEINLLTSTTDVVADNDVNKPIYDTKTYQF